MSSLFRSNRSANPAVTNPDIPALDQRVAHRRHDHEVKIDRKLRDGQQEYKQLLVTGKRCIRLGHRLIAIVMDNPYLLFIVSLGLNTYVARVTDNATDPGGGKPVLEQ